MPLRNPLSPLECKEIIRLRKSGLGINKIAKSMHRGKTTVKTFLENSANGDGPDLMKNVKYKELKPTSTPKNNKKETKTLIRVDYKKSAEKEKNSSKTPVDDAVHKKVSTEHQVIIKFLTKQEQTVKQIHTSMQRVYGDAAPNMLSISYWSAQFKNDRKSINDVKMKRVPSISKSATTPKMLIKSFTKDKVWSITQKPEAKLTNSNSTPHKIKTSSTPIKKTLSTSKIKKIPSDKRLSNNAKRLITIKLPTHKKLRDIKN